MNYDTRNSCGKRRGCEIYTTLPYDGKFKPVYSRVYGTRNDTKKVLSLAYISLDKELEEKRQVEKMAT